jgi:hypothetical protein
MARKALLDALASEALSLNDEGLPLAREAAEVFLLAEDHFKETRNIVRALSAYIKAPPGELSEPHTILEEVKSWKWVQLSFGGATASVAALGLDQTKRVADLVEHRVALVDGEPCPLCGAAEAAC